jgi:uncharacterized protein (TIGR00297 family)
MAAGWEWAVILVVWFVASQALTRRGAEAKAARTASVLPPERARGARQVLANGGLFAACALMSWLTSDARWGVAAVGALAAAAADTWATEIGLLAGSAPRALLTGSRVPPGTSGGVSWSGSAGAVAGALLVASLAALLLPEIFGDGARGGFAIIAAAGVLGGLSDSILGATLQAQRRCTACGAFTERRTHSCGSATAHARGLRWLENDLVNFLATVVGAIVALLLA